MTRDGSLRRAFFFLMPAALTGGFLRGAPQAGNPPDSLPPARQDDIRLPNGKSQREAILKADYEQNLKDARELAGKSRDFERELEKSDRYVLSLGLLKELDDIEKIARRIRGRMRRV